MSQECRKVVFGIAPNNTRAFRFPANTLQNGPNDGIAVVDAAGKVVQLVSYEGAFTAGSGPAKRLGFGPD